MLCTYDENNGLKIAHIQEGYVKVKFISRSRDFDFANINEIDDFFEGLSNKPRMVLTLNDTTLPDVLKSKPFNFYPAVQANHEVQILEIQKL